MLLAMHLALWAVSRDAVNGWLAACQLGFAMLALGIGGSSLASRGLGPRVPWILMGTIGTPVLFSALLTAVWRIADLPIRGWRRALLATSICVGLARLADVWNATMHWQHIDPPSWEGLYDSTRTWTVFPAWAIAVVTVSVYLLETIRDLGRKRLAARVLGLAAIPASILIGREILLTFGWLHGPTLLALTGLPYLLAASTIVALRYASALRGQVKDESVGQYKLVRRLDAGGMGELFLAVRTGPGGFSREVALKRMLAAGESESVDRLLSEARTAARLSHPNIVAVHDLGKIADGWYIVMEYLSGVSLAQVRIRAAESGQPVPLGLVAGVAEQVCRGLSYAHGEGVIHCDVSPGNVMVTFQGAVKVIDFGIASAAGTRPAAGIYGKTAYLSRDRLLGQPPSPQSDLHALGVLVYELVTGVRPFRGLDPQALSKTIVHGRYVAMSDLRDDVPPALESLVDRLLATDPVKRVGSAAEAAEELAALAAALPRVEPGGWVRQAMAGALRAERLAARLDTRPEPSTIALPMGLG